MEGRPCRLYRCTHPLDGCTRRRYGCERRVCGENDACDPANRQCGRANIVRKRAFHGLVLPITRPIAAAPTKPTSDSYRYGIERDDTGAVTGLTVILNGVELFTYEMAR